MDGGQQGDVGLAVRTHGDTAVPPTGSHGDQQGILTIGEVGSQIVGVVQDSLLVIRPAGLHLVEDLDTVLVQTAHAAAVDPDIEHAQCGGIHAGGLKALYGKLLAEQGDTAHVSDGGELVGAAQGVLPGVLLLGIHGGRVCVGDPLAKTTGHLILAHNFRFLSKSTDTKGVGGGRQTKAAFGNSIPYLSTLCKVFCEKKNKKSKPPLPRKSRRGGGVLGTYCPRLSYVRKIAWITQSPVISRRKAEPSQGRESSGIRRSRSVIPPANSPRSTSSVSSS